MLLVCLLDFCLFVLLVDLIVSHIKFSSRKEKICVTLLKNIVQSSWMGNEWGDLSAEAGQLDSLPQSWKISGQVHMECSFGRKLWGDKIVLSRNVAEKNVLVAFLSSIKFPWQRNGKESIQLCYSSTLPMACGLTWLMTCKLTSNGFEKSSSFILFHWRFSM